MKTINKFAAAALLALPSSVFAQKGEDVVAKVNGEPILLSEYEKTGELLLEQYSAVFPDFMQQKDAREQIHKMTMDKMVNELLIKQKAEAMKIKVYPRQVDAGVAEIKRRFSRDKDGSALTSAEADKLLGEELARQGITMQAFREKIQRDLMARKLVEETIKPRIKTPAEKDIKAYFDKINFVIKGDTKSAGLSGEELQEFSNIANKFKELSAERIRLRHILVKIEAVDLVSKNKALETANKIKKELDGGADLEALAGKYSQDKESAQRGGDIGYVIKGMLPAEIETKAFKMCPGDVSAPVESKFGYHIMRVDEKRIAQKLSFEAVKDDISQLIMQDSFAKEIEIFTEELRKAAKIEIFNEGK